MALLLFLLNGPLVFLSFCLLIVYFRNFIYLSFPAIFILPALQCYSSVNRFGCLYPFCYRHLYCPNLSLLFLPCWEPLDSWALQTWFAALQNVSVLNGYNKILFSLHGSLWHRLHPSKTGVDERLLCLALGPARF